MTKLKISVAGASGYTGMETLRYLAFHPNFEVDSLYGDSSTGKYLDELYPAFSEVYDLKIKDLKSVHTDSSDAVVLALPHGKSAEVANALIASGYKGKILDIGSDFRLKNARDYQHWYQMTHPYPNLLDRFVYALPEFNRKGIKNADYVSNPGCFATAIQLGLIPLVQAGAVKDVYVTGLTGSSGSGSQASATTHFSSRFGNLKAYKVFKHQHLGEVEQNIESLCKTKPGIHFVPVSAPIVRGIWITISGNLGATVDISEVFETAYYNAPMVRLWNGLPELKAVIGTGFADIGWEQNGHHFTIGVAIDNMGKGAAAQAIQNLNLMFDLPEETGINLPGIIL